MGELKIFPVSRSKTTIQRLADRFEAAGHAGISDAWREFLDREGNRFVAAGIDEDEIVAEFDRLAYAAAGALNRRIRSRAKAAIRREERLRLVQADQLAFDFDAAPSKAPLVDGREVG